MSSHGRHELKHYINYADLIVLRSRLPFVAIPDKNSVEGNGYRVKSLYFDNYNDKALMGEAYVYPIGIAGNLGL